MTKKFIIRYKYSPTDLIFICTKQIRTEMDLYRKKTVEIWKYCVEREITPGYEGSTRYSNVEFRLNDTLCTVEPYKKNAIDDFYQDDYLRRIGL